MFTVGAPAAWSAPPPSDGKGYIDSTARCASPDVAVVFGSTNSSRVAICRDTAGEYEYRGVRVRDGAKLILPATPTGDGGFVAKQDGVAYTVTESALVISSGGTVIRREAMVDFHGSGATAPKAPATTKATPAPAPTVTAPIDPLPAEVGGSAANG